MTHLVGLLKDDPVFGHLTEEHLKELAGLAMQRSFQTDEVVCLQGDSWPYTFYIVDGSLRSVISAPDGRNFVGSTWGRGDVFWAPTLFDDEPMPSTLEAVTSTSIYLWRGEDALEQVLRNPNAVRALLRRQTQIIRQRRQGIYGLAFNPLASRLAQLLVDRIFISGEPTVQRDLTLGDMAEMLASSPEVVCRLLSQFQSLGAISMTRASITLHDRQALERIISRD